MKRSDLVFGLALALAASEVSKAYAADVTECDLLAAHPSDPDKLAPGLESAAITDTKAAIAACERDLAKDPKNGRLEYQLGRVLVYDKQLDKGLPHLKASADSGYRQAMFVYGYVFATARGVPKDSCVAARNWRPAAQRGHYASEVSYSRGVLKGDYSACGEQAGVDEIRGFLESARKKTKSYYEELLVEDWLDRAGRR